MVSMRRYKSNDNSRIFPDVVSAHHASAVASTMSLRQLPDEPNKTGNIRTSFQLDSDSDYEKCLDEDSDRQLSYACDDTTSADGYSGELDIAQYAKVDKGNFRVDDFAYEAIGKLNTTIEEGTTQDDIPKEQMLLIGQHELFPE
ncbi:uncharacterized protein [Apostichopus japonicus]|uniref:uncharacterized protein n=1 Tax=Stichopus japonicus TaxID=307972 RepID=UPI003AB397F5